MIVVLENIRSVYNVGSIFRTADAAGVRRVYLCGITPGPKDRFGRKRRDFIKVSLGAEDCVAWKSYGSAIRLIGRLRREGYKIFAVEQSECSVPYHKISEKDFDFEKTALVLGNEVDGLSGVVLRQADKILEIPMKGAMVRQADHPRHAGYGKESLNVAVVFGVVIYHLKQVRI